jgi:hypothetical protein
MDNCRRSFRRLQASPASGTFWRITSTCNSKTFVPSSAFRRRKPLEQLEAGTSWRRARSWPSSVGHPRSSTMPGHTLFSTRTEANSGFLTSSDTCHGTRTHQGFSEELAVSSGRGVYLPKRGSRLRRAGGLDTSAGERPWPRRRLTAIVCATQSAGVTLIAGVMRGIVLGRPAGSRDREWTAADRRARRAGDASCRGAGGIVDAAALLFRRDDLSPRRGRLRRSDRSNRCRTRPTPALRARAATGRGTRRR